MRKDNIVSGGRKIGNCGGKREIWDEGLQRKGH